MLWVRRWVLEVVYILSKKQTSKRRKKWSENVRQHASVLCSLPVYGVEGKGYCDRARKRRKNQREKIETKDVTKIRTVVPRPIRTRALTRILSTRWPPHRGDPLSKLKTHLWGLHGPIKMWSIDCLMWNSFWIELSSESSIQLLFPLPSGMNSMGFHPFDVVILWKCFPSIWHWISSEGHMDGKGGIRYLEHTYKWP